MQVVGAPVCMVDDDTGIREPFPAFYAPSASECRASLLLRSFLPTLEQASLLVARFLGGHAACAFDARIRKKRGSKRSWALVERLMRERKSDRVLAACRVAARPH